MYVRLGSGGVANSAGNAPICSAATSGLTETGNGRDGHRGHDRAADDAYRRDACDCGQQVTAVAFLGILRHSHQT